MTTALLVSLLLSASPSSEVSDVVLFPDRADVTRTRELRCTPGLTVHFEALPPAADLRGMRALARGAGQALGVRVVERRLEEAYGPERAAAEREQEVLEQRARDLEEARRRTDRQDTLGTRYAAVAQESLARELALPRPDPRAWTQALDAALETSLAAARAQAELEVQGEELARARTGLEARLQQLKDAARRVQRDAHVQVACTGEGQVRVELTYRVTGAGWRPAYEARADAAGRAVELSAFADVHQATGEPWEGARVALSTAVPSSDATPPTLRPVRVGVQHRLEPRRALVRREEVAQQEDARGEEVAVEEAAVAGLVTRAEGLSVRLPLGERVSVPADGRVLRLAFGTARLPAKFALRAVPRLSPGAYRVADVVNTAPFPLLPGPVDTYRGEALTGRHALPRVAQGAPVTLTFGVEEAVRVERKVLEESAATTGFFGGKRRFRFDAEVVAANFGGRAEVLEVVDGVPVPEVAEVTVALAEGATAPAETQADAGRLTWRVPLPSGGAAQRVRVAFLVDVPAEWDVRGGSP